MTARPVRTILGLFFACLVACDGSGGEPSVDGGGFDRPSTGMGGSGGSRSIDARPRPGAPPNSEAKLIVGGLARLVGTHSTACSNQTPASDNGDRWCAFSKPGRIIGRTDLWVVNVTKAISGSIKCDGTDTNCLRLHDNLWTGQPDVGPAHPTTHRFDGDTLVFHANASTNVDIYSGPIFAWRPGWAAPKQVSAPTNRAITCSAHFRAESILCIENITPIDEMPVQFDLTAGRLATGVKLVARITPLRPGSQASQWRTSFSRDGEWLAYSTGGKQTAQRETLFVTRTDDIGNPEKLMTVGVGISRWNISLDSKKYYYFRGYNYSTEGDPRGNLSMADFPSGMNEVMLAPNVGTYQLLFDGTDTDRGIGFFDQIAVGRGTFRIMWNRDDPMTVVRIQPNVSGALVSLDLKYVYFSKDFDETTGYSDAYIIKTNGMDQCTLTTNPTTDLFGTPFPSSSSLALWADKIDPIDGVGEGWVGDPDSCGMKRKWSDNYDYHFYAGDEGLIYSDEGQAETATLKFMKFSSMARGAAALGTPVEIQKQVNRIFAVTPNREAVLFNINRDVAFDGIYLWSKFPWTSSGAGTTPDAGSLD